MGGEDIYDQHRTASKPFDSKASNKGNRQEARKHAAAPYSFDCFLSHNYFYRILVMSYHSFHQQHFENSHHD